MKKNRDSAQTYGAKKLVVGFVSTALPNARSGQGWVLKQLIDGMSFEKCYFFSDSLNNESGQNSKDSPVYFIPFPPLRARDYIVQRIKLFLARNEIGMVKKQIDERKEILVNAIRSKGIEVLIPCTASLADLPAAFLAAQETNIPFFPYIFDDYVQQWRNTKERAFALDWEKRLIPHAADVFCPNESLSAEYTKRHGNDPIILRNPITQRPKFSPQGLKPEKETAFKVAYTGSVYDAQIDSLERLIEAINRVNKNIEFHIYSPQPPEAAGALSKVSSVIWHGFVSHEDSIRAQQEADILFLPLSFSENMAGVVQSAAPGKLAEYLSSSTPILVHAPKDSFVTKFLRENDAAYIVDTPDFELLASKLTDIIHGDGDPQKIIKNAYKLSEQFSLEKSVENLSSALVRKFSQ